MLGSWLCQKRMGASSRPFDLTPKEVAIKWQRSADLGRWAVKDKGSTGRGRPHRTRGRGSFEGGGSGRPAAFLRGALFVLFAGRCANPRLPPGVPFLEGRKRGALSPEGAGGAAATASAQSPVGGGAGGTGPPLFPRPPGSRAERNWPRGVGLRDPHRSGPRPREFLPSRPFHQPCSLRHSVAQKEAAVAPAASELGHRIPAREQEGTVVWG